MGQRKIIIAISGASGSIYARLLCEALIKAKTEGHNIGEIAVITTDNGLSVMQFEDSSEWLHSSQLTLYNNKDLFSSPASGSASYNTMIIIPCSMGMVGRIAGCISNDLISRAADVMLKERRQLILVTRETPLSTIHIRNMMTISECGGIICPASPSFYSKPQTIAQLCNTTIERLLSLISIDTMKYEWGGAEHTVK